MKTEYTLEIAEVHNRRRSFDDVNSFSEALSSYEDYGGTDEGMEFQYEQPLDEDLDDLLKAGAILLKVVRPGGAARAGYLERDDVLFFGDVTQAPEPVRSKILEELKAGQDNLPSGLRYVTITWTLEPTENWEYSK